MSHFERSLRVWRRGQVAAVVVAAATASAACNEPIPEPPAPTPRRIVQAPPRAAKRAPSRFRNPDRDPLPERAGDQLGPEELETAIAQAAQQIAMGDQGGAMQTLRRCANKLEPSARCEGELGMLFWEVGRHRVHARAYVGMAASTEDPKADAGFWRRLGDTATAMTDFDVAGRAYQNMVALGGTSADDYEKLARALLGSEQDAPAMAALEKGYAADPERHELLFELAVLMARTPDKKRALDLFTEYQHKTKGKDPTRDAAVAERIEVLRGAAPR